MDLPDFGLVSLLRMVVLDLDMISMELPEVSFQNIIRWGSASAMMFGGVVPFIPQYADIKRSANADGFSTFVCLTLLVANILRIMFWFGKFYEFPLLFQSIIMILTMIVMMHLCVTVKQKSEIIASKSRTFTADGKKCLKTEECYSSHTTSCCHANTLPGRTFLDFDTRYFWKWTDFASYLQFLIFFVAFLTLMNFLFLESTFYVETVGFLAVFAEACLGVPQFYKNFQNKSTVGMSKKMVGFWTLGDVFKTVYFILRAAPAQFWICGVLQISIDLSIFAQVLYYGGFQGRIMSKSAVS
ncbi:Hypothetical predicted protein [Octopus vulgaris]|nr:Hypothetical predicted protein [Octopus vulgaris]